MRTAMRFGCLLPLLLFVPVWGADCIEVVSAGGSPSFWGAVGEGAMAAGRELGVAIHYLNPSEETDKQGQDQLIRQLASLKCRALVLAPNAPERARQSALLMQQGTPVVFIDRTEADARPLALVGTDNDAAGRLAGEQMVRRLRGTGLHRVVLMRFKKGVQSTDEREQGFLDVVRKAGLTVVADPYLGPAESDARLRSEQVLRRLGKGFDAIFTPNETTTSGTLQTVQKLGLAGKVMLIGFDINPLLYEAIRQRTISVLVLQRPFQMGYVGVTLAWRAAHGARPSAARVDSGVTLLTHDNMNQKDILFFSNYRGVKPQ
ncbi:substrate-binding domain-containing protein [Paludibacterium sp. B53371]|uniref:substrate-binding domain-containing protein n=1 Tax=Paludibacterium sp. B53371 TaxID=2806263 RepID=UPI001C03BF6A|nr:substrate-binding domain-containing protein [Paludibacterium sp. B53371]